MVSSLTAANKMLGEARRLQTQVRVASGVYAVGVRALLALFSAGVVDILIPLPNALRGLFLLALLGYVGISLSRCSNALPTLRRRWPLASGRPALRPEAVAREIETQRPELDNALIHAVQFADAGIPPDSPSAILMRRELDRAEQEAARLPLAELVDRAPLMHGRNRMLLTLALLLLTAVVSPRAYRFELPRLFLFWQDRPPFTLTDFTVSPGDLRVRSGENVAISVKLGGLLPSRLELVTGRDGERPQSLPMAANEAGVYATQLENLSKDTWYYLSGDTGRSDRYRLQVDNAPRLRRLTVTIHPPEYTKQPVRTVEIKPDGEISALPGSRIEMEVEADQPLESGTLRIGREGMAESNVSLTPRKEAPTHVLASFTIERNGTYQVGLNGAGPARGLRTPGAATGKIVLLSDEKPTVTFLLPGQNVMATPEMTVPLKVEATDDVALQRVEMHRIVNRGADTARPIDLPDRPREWTHRDSLDLKALNAKPGDVIEYYATAYDNDPTGVHNTDSDRYWVWVVSAEDYRKALAEQRGPTELIAQYRAQTDALRQLAEAQEQLTKEMAAHAKQVQQSRSADAATQQKLKAETARLREQQKQLEAQAGELARQMREIARQPAQVDGEKAMQRKLSRMANDVEQAQQAMRSAARAPSPGQMPPHGKQAAQQLKQSLQNRGEKLEKTLEAMEKTLPLYHDFARLQALAKEQAQLAQQAQQLRDALQNGKADAFTQSRLKSLAEQQSALRDTLSQLQQDLKDHARDAQSAAPEAAQTASKIADAIAQQTIPQTMQMAQQSLSQQNAAQGAAQADEARRALESLLGQGQKGQQQAQGACNKQGMAQMGQGMGQCLSQMSGQMGSGMPSQSQGQNSGMGQGSGQPQSGNQANGYSPPQPGSRPGNQKGNGQSQGQQATVMMLTQQPAGGGVREKKQVGGRGERINALSADNTEKTTAAAPRPLPKATDRDASRYPSEYRRLVRDYFKSVAGEK